MEWLETFWAALDDEFGPRPHVATLATVDRAGDPRARSVVCRTVDESGLYFVSDARSGKNGQLRLNVVAEAVFWLSARREQYRIRGTVAVIGSTDSTIRARLWTDLSDATRATFFWPAPGTARTDDPTAFPRGISVSVAPPQCFEVLVLDPYEADFLDLKPHPHDRRRWVANEGWREQRLNP